MSSDGRAAPPGREGPRAGVWWGGIRSPTAFASGSKADGASAGVTVAWGLVEQRLQDVPEIVMVLPTCSIVRSTQKEQQESAPVQPPHSRGLTVAHRAIGHTKDEEMKTRDHTSIHALDALV